MCPEFSTPWNKISTGRPEEWPADFQRDGDFMFFQTKLCVPTNLLPKVVRDLHLASGHMSQQKLYTEMLRRYAVPSPSKTRTLTQEVTTRCETCQAAEHRHTSGKFPLQPFPIPPVPMDSIAVDIFLMKPTRFEGKIYDCMLVIVDRHTGWVVAIPDSIAGMTSKRAATKVFLHHWDFFWAPPNDLQ